MARPQGRECKARLPSTDAAVLALKRRGLRASASRRLIIQILVEASVPLSAQEISRGPGGASIGLDLASVYRNLEILEDHGLVHQLHLGRGPARYVIAARGRREYIACDRCGAVTEVAPDELNGLRSEIRERFGYEVGFSEVPMVGRCADCAAGSRYPG